MTSSYYEPDPELDRLMLLAKLPPISESPCEGRFRIESDGSLTKISSDLTPPEYKVSLPGEDVDLDRRSLFAADDEVWGPRGA